MDRYSIDSETSGPLEFLSPPVKRIHTIYNKEQPIEIVNLKNIRLKSLFKNNTKGVGGHIKTGDEPSTSLLLKKTSQPQVLDKYSVNCATFGPPHRTRSPTQQNSKVTRNKPLIKVTVIPNAAQTVNTKLYRKRRHIPKKVQSTSSNQETSVQTKNVYLVVAGRRREKISEIRTTGSAEFSDNQIYQNEEIPINDFPNIRRLVQSLDMDRKRKKDKKTKNNDGVQQTSYMNEGIVLNECTCTNTCLGCDVSPSKSRVKIYGQLGLTEDDRYVLKYGASVNDKPVMSNVAQLLSDFSPCPNVHNDEGCRTSFNSSNCMADCNGRSSISRTWRDSCIQTDFERNCECLKPMNICEFKKPGKVTQGTQVNFNIQFANTSQPKIAKPLKCIDKKIQCNCCAANDFYENKCDNGDDAMQDSQSPLVIISVYPKQNQSEVCKPNKPAIENKRCPSPAKVTVSNRKPKLDKATDKRSFEPNKREIKRPPVNPSRSPSPAKKVSRTKIQENKYNTETKFVHMSKEKRSPDRHSAIKIIKDKIQEKDKMFEAATPKRSRLPSPSTTRPQFSRNLPNLKKNKIRSQETGTNTNHQLTKKALVDSYTKKISARMNQESNHPHTSKVTINIDGKKEYYDVMFDHDMDTTDVRVQRKIKDIGSQKSYDDDSCASLENLLLLPEVQGRARSQSLALYNNQSHCGTQLAKRVSRLTIRDSLEISHRRDKVSHGSKNTQTSLTVQQDEIHNEETEFLAPIKHFIGDDCSIYDPMARDREIRQLLGVDKRRKTTSKTEQDQVPEMNTPCPFDCFYRKKCNKNLMSVITQSPNLKMTSNYVQCSSVRCDNNIDNNKINALIQKPAEDRTSLYQKLLHKRNIHMFLQVEQYSKQKPIVLSRRQYNKVKRTIQKTISKNISHQKNKFYPKYDVSVGEIKEQKKINTYTFLTKEVQTEVTGYYAEVEERIKEILVDAVHERELKKHKLTLVKDSSSKRDKTKGRKVFRKISDDANAYKERDKIEVSTRRTVSSVEVHYANVAYAKRVTFSSQGDYLSNKNLKKGNSFLTIFKGHRNSPTPNLGTSIYSLYSDDHSDKSIKVLMEPRDANRKKPFLRRLMSYLVMRSTKGSVPKLNMNHASRPPTAESSIDSYHISSSLAGIEVSSSIYDTSASFYSNHTIFPVNSRMKRGFFSSVRGFLSNRRN